jgi:hypothetical protein
MKENELGRFELEKHLHEHPDDNLAIVSKYLWEFNKPSVKKEMYGELTTLTGFPIGGEIFETIEDDLKILMVGYVYHPPKVCEEMVCFSDGHVKRTEQDEKEYTSLLDQSITVASETLEHYSGHYKTDLKQEHIQEMWIQMYFHNLENEIGKEVFLNFRSKDFSRTDVGGRISLDAEKIFSSYITPIIN